MLAEERAQDVEEAEEVFRPAGVRWAERWAEDRRDHQAVEGVGWRCLYLLL